MAIRPQPMSFYVLDEQSAREFDAARPEGERRFTALLPGGNAYLLDYEVFEPSDYPDLDPGDAEPGCRIPLEQALDPAHAQSLLSGLIEMGYAVSRYPDCLLVVAWHRDTLTETVARDLQRLLALQGEQAALTRGGLVAWQETLYLIDEEKAEELDRGRSRNNGELLFASMLAWGNATLVREVDLDAFEQADIDPACRENGYSLDLAGAMGPEQCQVLVQRLVDRGYGVCLFTNHLLLMPFYPRVTEMVNGDLRAILAGTQAMPGSRADEAGR